MTQLTEEQHDQLTVRCSCGQRVPRAEIEAVLAERDNVALLDSDSQAAEGAYVCDKCGQSKEHTPECPSPAWCPGCGSRVIGHDWTVCHNATTAMRDKCVETVKAIHEERLRDLRTLTEQGDIENEDADYERAVLFVLSNVIDAIQSLTLDQVKPEKQ